MEKSLSLGLNLVRDLLNSGIEVNLTLYRARIVLEELKELEKFVTINNKSRRDLDSVRLEGI